MLLFSEEGIAANLKIRDVELSLSGSSLSVNCKLSWDNSWRDNYNWDAVWIFAKVSQGGVWKPLLLESSGHQVDDLSYSLGSSENGAVGMFIFRPGVSSGNVENISCRLLFKDSGITQEMLDAGEGAVLLQGIEMVYIPWGKFKMGDGSSVNSLAGEITELNTLSSTFPNGYKGFYMMKYELSQEQYVTFLNSLTLAEQTALLGNLTALNEGDYVFGAPDRVSQRNGIVLYKRNGISGKMFFACNYNRRPALSLSEDVNQSDDGQNIACNFVGITDLSGYASWSGLRPMSEYEYEKACRGVGVNSVSGEYAWNRNTGATKGSGLLNEGREDEYVSSGNVNYGNGFPGPVRCGAFGSGGTDQIGSGAGYWGVMELSGNLRELCCNNNSLESFDREVHGKGIYNPGMWSSTSSGHWCSRGGGYSSDLSQLQVSDRSDIVTSSARQPYFGLRCVRTYEPSHVGLNPGSISGPTGQVTACLNESVTITLGNGNEATITGIENSLPIRYKWYVNNSELIGEQGPSLEYDFIPTTYGNLNLTFVRKAFSGVGEASVSYVVNVFVRTASFTFNRTSGGIDVCDNVTNITASPVQSGTPMTYQWTWNGKVLGTGATYTPTRAHFNNIDGNYTVLCTSSIGGCVSKATANVNISIVSGFCCGRDSWTDTRDRQVYTTLKFGSQCWMGRNINYASSDRYCYGNNTANCDTYGGYYTWGTAQSICPSGWKVASKSEWEYLLNNYMNWGSYGWQTITSSPFYAKYGGAYSWGDKKWVGRGTTAYFWTSSYPNGSGSISYTVAVTYNKSIVIGNGNDNSRRNVRCMKK